MLTGIAMLNRGRLAWAANTDAAIADFTIAAKSFERAISEGEESGGPAAVSSSTAAAAAAAAADAGAFSLEGLIRRSAASTFYNLGAAQEAITRAREVSAAAAALPSESADGSRSVCMYSAHMHVRIPMHAGERRRRARKRIRISR